MRTTAALILFKIGWALCLYCAVEKLSWVAGVFSFAALGFLFYLSPHRRVDFFKVISIILAGIFFEIINLKLDFYAFHLTPRLPPLWILLFWPTFAILFLEAIKMFYSKSSVLLIALGLTGGAGYYLGEKLQLLTFFEPKIMNVLLFSLVWGVEFLALVKLSKAIDKKWATS